MAANTNKPGTVKEKAEAQPERFILRLQGPTPTPGQVPYITHLGYHVHGKSIEVPIGGELEVTEAQYKAITEQELAQPYSWSDAASSQPEGEGGGGGEKPATTPAVVKDGTAPDQVEDK